ncbi:MAG: acyltransferase [Pirellulales bacterium]|nr:acyltransferase [Pirellulales bacterium]
MPTRLIELDGLRGLAAVAVVLFHYTTRYEHLFGHATPLAASLAWGFYGVDLFFMLSGFVISLVLARRPAAGDFVAARFARLYPAFWVSMLFTAALLHLAPLPGHQLHAADVAWNLTMMPELFDARPVDGAYWSLQVELLFYAAMLLLASSGLLRHRLLVLSGWLAIAALSAWAVQYHPNAVGWMVWLERLRTLAGLKFIHLFALGIVCFDAWAGRSRLAHLLLTATCVGIEALLAGWQSAAVIAGLAAVLWLAVFGRLPWLAARPLAALGGISYTLYLVHQNLGYLVIHGLEGSGCHPHLAVGAAVGVALLAATALARFVERPAQAAIRAGWQHVCNRSLCLMPPTLRAPTELQGP